MGETATSQRKICVGQFAGAHGVRGLVKLRSFTEDPEAIFGYAPLTDEAGDKVYSFARKSVARDHFVVAVDGVEDREAAEELRGERLYVSRDILPPTTENQYYEADLIGLEAVDAAGKAHGKVMGVFDYGAGAFLEIGLTKKDSFMLPFKSPFVGDVDAVGGKIVIAPPEDDEE